MTLIQDDIFKDILPPEIIEEARTDIGTCVIELPIYWTIFKKTKKNKTILVGMNWYRNAHFIQQNNCKKYFHKLIQGQLQRTSIGTLESVTVHYDLFPKLMNCDAMNVISCIDKFLMDALQEYKIIENDNVKYYKGGSWNVGERSKNNPRITATIKGGN